MMSARTSGGSSTSAWSRRPRTNERNPSTLVTAMRRTIDPSGRRASMASSPTASTAQAAWSASTSRRTAAGSPSPNCHGARSRAGAVARSNAAGAPRCTDRLDAVETELPLVVAGVVEADEGPAPVAKRQAHRIDRALDVEIAKREPAALGHGLKQRDKVLVAWERGERGGRRSLAGGAAELPHRLAPIEAGEVDDAAGQVQRGELVGFEAGVGQVVVGLADAVAVDRPGVVRRGVADGDRYARLAQCFLVALEGAAELGGAVRVARHPLAEVLGRQEPLGVQERSVPARMPGRSASPRSSSSPAAAFDEPVQPMTLPTT